jgi:hypothetical protein
MENKVLIKRNKKSIWLADGSVTVKKSFSAIRNYFLWFLTGYNTLLKEALSLILLF